jgi:transcriptional antiterminator NusG
MNYYAIQVLSRQEKKFILLAEDALERLRREGKDAEGKLHWPRRTLNIRKQGKKRTWQAPIFPGYLFWQAEELDPDVYWLFKRTEEQPQYRTAFGCIGTAPASLSPAWRDCGSFKSEF